MRLYECVMIARQDVSSGHVEELLNEFCAIIENDGGSIQETGKLEYTQARVGIILKVKDEKTGLIVWTHSYWYSGIELSSTAQICAKNSVRLIKKLFNT